jgi:hypothetical protein
MRFKVRPLTEISTEAIRVLCKEIGVANTIRFLSQFTAGYGNYTEEREHLFANMTVNDIVSAIQKARES